MKLTDLLKDKPVIPAIRNLEGVRFEEFARSAVLFVIGGTIFDLPILVARAERVRKSVFVDVDLIKGVGRDSAGIRYLARESRVHGVITTKSSLIRSIKKEGMISIQRLFVLDSESLSGALGVVERSRPEAIEILPGLILPKIMDRIRSKTSVPVIAGGLITSTKEVREILASGAIGISSSSTDVWNFTS